MNTTVFPAFRTTDAYKTIALLEALGFTERIIVRQPNDDAIVEHAEFVHRNGGLMFGTARQDSSDLDAKIGGQSCYIVVETDEAVDEAFQHAVDAGARPVEHPVDQSYGGRGATVKDHDGNLWALGSYRGADAEVRD